MSNYIETMKTKPAHHQRAFALSVSGGVTLVIFALWSFVTFGRTSTVATNPDDNNLAAVVGADPDTTGGDTQTATDMVTPFENAKAGIQSAVDAIKAGFSNAENSAKNVDLNANYQDAKNQALNNNGGQ